MTTTYIFPCMAENLGSIKEWLKEQPTINDHTIELLYFGDLEAETTTVINALVNTYSTLSVEYHSLAEATIRADEVIGATIANSKTEGVAVLYASPYRKTPTIESLTSDSPLLVQLQPQQALDTMKDCSCGDHEIKSKFKSVLLGKQLIGQEFIVGLKGAVESIFKASDKLAGNIAPKLKSVDLDTLKLLAYNYSIYTSNLKVDYLEETVLNDETPVTVSIITYGRDKTTLPLTLQSVLMQTKLPERIILLTDNETENRTNYAKDDLYVRLFRIATEKGIKVEFFASPGHTGQVRGHEFILSLQHVQGYLFRVDDDVVLEPTVLEKLYNKMTGNVKAIAPIAFQQIGSILDKPDSAQGTFSIGKDQSPQFYKCKEDIKVEHLHCLFMYDLDFVRKNNIHYNTNLSQIGHGEELMFSHSIFKAGGELIVAHDAISWHYRYPYGGIRQDNVVAMWYNDYKILGNYYAEHGLPTVLTDLFPMEAAHGIGDAYVLLSIMPEIVKHVDGKRRMVLFTMYPEVFEGVRGIEVFEMKDKFKILDAFEIVVRDPIYRFCTLTKWDKHIKDAYREIYLTDDIWKMFEDITFGGLEKK